MTKSLTLLVFSLLLSILTSPAIAAPGPRVVIVVNRAEWCSVCKANEPRVAKLLMSDGAIAMVVNDITDDEHARRSAVALKSAGLEHAIAAGAATGVLYLFDARTKRPLHQITVANTDREIQMVIEMAKKEASAP